MDVEGCIRTLNEALPLQYRSAVAFTHAAAAMKGYAFSGVVASVRGFAAAELDDARRLAEKVTTLGGVPACAVATIEHHDDPDAMLEWLIAAETECVEALQSVIPHSGQEGRSEALEHRLEHVIMRKQEQVDTLVRVLDDA